MAYVSLSNKALTDKTVTAAEIITQMVSMGWTVYDDQSGSYYKVLRSNGESGTKQWLYIKVGWTSTYVTIDAYGYWNSATHTTTAPVLMVQGSIAANCNLWMFGNKDFVAIIQDTSGTIGSNCIFGHVVTLPASAVNTTTTAGITSGTSKVISVTSVTGFLVGARYQIFDPATGYKQTFLCTAIGASDITADTITTVSYGSGSVVGTHPMPVFVGASTLLASSSLNHHRTTYNSTVGSLSSTATALSIEYVANQIPYIGTPAKRAFYPPLMFETGTGANSYHFLGTMDDGNGYYYVSAAISTLNSNDSYTAANFDAIYMGSNATGSSTGSNTTTTMYDTTKSWTTDQWAGKTLVLTSGTEIGQIRKIVSNTATSVTISPDFSVIPISGSYVVADRAYRHFLSSYSILFREGV